MKKNLVIALLCLFVAACSSDKKFAKVPVDQLIMEMDKEKNFTIILFDMEAEENTFSDDIYRHKYKIVTPALDGKPQERTTNWYGVDKVIFNRHLNDLGMEVASKSNGTLSKAVAPPGYSNYVGNSQYGQWNTGSGGNSFWAFYGQYAFMSSMLGLASNSIYRNDYNNYRGNYHGRQPYYGNTVNGRPAYGTLSDASRRMNPAFHSRPSATTFKNKINDKVSRSDRTSKPTGSSSSSSSSSRSRSRRRR